MDEAERERADKLLQRFERDFSVDRRSRLRVRNPARPYALLGLLVGVVCAAGIALADRGGFLTTGILQILLALCVLLSVLLLLVSLVARGWGRRAAGVLLGLALAAFVALFVLGVAALALDLDLG